MIYLWKVEKDELVLDLREVLKYEDLAAIYRRDSTSKSKDKAMKEFRYIDFIANRDGYCVQNGLNSNDAHEFAREHSGLPTGWKPDDAVIKAIKCAKRLNGGVIESLIDTTVAAFATDAKLMSKTKKLADEMLKKPLTISDITTIMDITKATIAMSTDIPIRVNKLIALKEEYLNQKSKTTNALRGGGEISPSYDGGGIEKYRDSGEVEELD